MSDYIVRAMVPGDLNWVRSSWLKSYAASPLARLAGSAYWPGHHDLIDRLLQRADVRVACSPEHEATIVGWACIEWPKTLHYVHVREEFRRHGVARELLRELGSDVVCSHRSDVVGAITLPATWYFSLYAMMEAA